MDWAVWFQNEQGPKQAAEVGGTVFTGRVPSSACACAVLDRLPAALPSNSPLGNSTSPQPVLQCLAVCSSCSRPSKCAPRAGDAYANQVERIVQAGQRDAVVVPVCIQRDVSCKGG